MKILANWTCSFVRILPKRKMNQFSIFLIHWWIVQWDTRICEDSQETLRKLPREMILLIFDFRLIIDFQLSILSFRRIFIEKWQFRPEFQVQSAYVSKNALLFTVLPPSTLRTVAMTCSKFLICFPKCTTNPTPVTLK